MRQRPAVAASPFQFSPNETIMALCWNCQNELDSKHFCDRCRKIQPTPPGVDFFIFFSLPQKLTLNLEILSRRFYELSRQFHPDFYQKLSPREREISTEKTSFLNQAYQILRDPWRRMEYAVGLEGIDAKKEGKAVSPELLKEVLIIQEEGGENPEVLERLRERLGLLGARRERLFLKWDQTDLRRPIAEEMVALLHEKKYLETALRNLEKV